MTTPVRLEHAYVVCRENGAIVCEATSTLACVDRDGKLQAMPEWLSAAK
jgi:acyl-CoA thioester hydrolase